VCVLDCPQPQDIENGGLDIDGSPIDGLGYPNGTMALYSCAQDYQLEPSGVSGRRICLNGAWSGQQATCGQY